MERTLLGNVLFICIMVSSEAEQELRTCLTDQGLLMNSEVWVCLTEKERCLPFMLVERGFDVWVSLPCVARYGCTPNDKFLAREQSRQQILQKVD